MAFVGYCRRCPNWDYGMPLCRLECEVDRAVGGPDESRACLSALCVRTECGRSLVLFVVSGCTVLVCCHCAQCPAESSSIRGAAGGASGRRRVVGGGVLQSRVTFLLQVV
ncbi:hypothetical protein M758_UG241800 [Ceratodon purpureus]|nr:hypothetical protein M758_UG241700 [Ceratodon purpureus]KAG0596306.1 hypothetical protein M758_UG241800 [Ceratodon purpureus]